MSGVVVGLSSQLWLSDRGICLALAPTWLVHLSTLRVSLVCDWMNGELIEGLPVR